MKRFLPIVLIAGAVAVAALAVNLLLVGYAADRDDPVGKLNPRAVLSTTTDGGSPGGTGSTTGPSSSGTESSGPTSTEDDGGDDRGRGRNRGRGGDDDD